MTASAQLPAPLLFYPFDEAAGSTTVTGSSGNRYFGTVEGSVVFGITGAPGWSDDRGDDEANYFGLLDDLVVYQKVLSLS